MRPRTTRTTTDFDPLRTEAVVLQDAVQSTGLSIFAQIGLLMFLFAFIVVSIRVLLYDKEEAQKRAELPLDEDETVEHS